MVGSAYQFARWLSTIDKREEWLALSMSLNPKDCIYRIVLNAKPLLYSRTMTISAICAGTHDVDTGDNKLARGI
jgi:hypothetical protein